MNTLGDILSGEQSEFDKTVQDGIQQALRQVRINPNIAQSRLVQEEHLINPRLTFIEFVNKVNPRFTWYKHNLILARILQSVIDGQHGEHARIIINMPPRHGKTELVSKLFAAYWLYCFPDEWVGLSTYVADLSSAISSVAQQYFTSAGGILDSQHTASRHWETDNGGGMWAAGVGGPITGKGFNLGIIDDPIKNAEEAASETVGETNRSWYQSTFYTREQFEHTCIIVMNTRWPGPGDLVGWLFEQEEEAGSDDPDELENWHVVCMPAIYEPDNTPKIPISCVREPDWRNAGEALFPERYGLKRLKKIRRVTSGYFWASLYQQNPTDREGHRFKRSWFKDKVQDIAPESLHKDVFYWDFGGGEETNNDPTVGVRMRRISDREFWIIEVVRFKKTPEGRDSEIRRTAERSGKKVSHWAFQEPGTAGKDQAKAFRALLSGFEVHTERVTGDKEIRGDGFQAACEAGFIYLKRGHWNGPFFDELVTLWTGRYDDQGESASGAFNKLVQLYRRKRKTPTSRSFSTLGV